MFMLLSSFLQVLILKSLFHPVSAEEYKNNQTGATAW